METITINKDELKSIINDNIISAFDSLYNFEEEIKKLDVEGSYKKFDNFDSFKKDIEDV